MCILCRLPGASVHETSDLDIRIMEEMADSVSASLGINLANAGIEPSDEVGKIVGIASNVSVQVALRTLVLWGVLSMEDIEKFLDERDRRRKAVQN